MTVVVIYGGSGAIGAAAARVFASEGHHVCLGARRLDRAEALVDEIRAAGGEAHAMTVDVADADQLEALVTGTIER